MFSKQLHFLVIFIGLISIALAAISNDSLGGRAFVRLPTCREHLPSDDDHIKIIYKKIIPPAHLDMPKGYLGKVGILGGAYDGSGAAYFAAIAALKVQIILYLNSISTPDYTNSS